MHLVFGLVSAVSRDHVRSVNQSAEKTELVYILVVMNQVIIFV